MQKPQDSLKFIPRRLCGSSYLKASARFWRLAEQFNKPVGFPDAEIQIHVIFNRVA
jgi:hypothetical protein